MAIKTKSSRDTYRSNVKLRPLRQNGLEAQYQGLDVKEVNIDHSGLPILARGGFQNPRNFSKVFKEYIVDIDADEYFPKAALVFKDRSAPWIVTWQWESGKNDWTGDINFALLGVDYTLVLRNTSTTSETAFGQSIANVAYISIGNGSGLSSGEFSDSLLTVLARIEVVLDNLFGSGNWSHSETSTSFSITDSSKTSVNYIRNTSVSYLKVAQTAGSTPPAVRAGNWSHIPHASSPTYVGINELDTNDVTFVLTDPAGTSKTFEYTTHASNVNGSAITHPGSSSNIAIVIPNDSFSYLNTMSTTTGSIAAAFGNETFTFELHQSGSIETVDLDGKSYAGIFRVTETDPGKIAIPVTEDKIVISLTDNNKGSANLTSAETFNTIKFLDVSTDTFGDQSEKHRWRLNGFKEQTTNTQMFYEDLRVDVLQSFSPHERRKEGILFKPTQQSRGALDDGSTSGNKGFHVGGIIVNADDHMNSRAGSGTSLDPVTLARSVTKLSDELLIRQTPKRQEVFGTFRDNHIWREDRHFLSMVDQRWEQMQERALLYDTDLESHISALLDTNFADEQYFDDNLLSGRVDVFGRLSRVFDTHNEIIYERHRGSVFDQFLDPSNDFKITQDNRYPKADTTQEYTQVVYNHVTLADEQINHTNDPAFEDVQGKRRTLQPDLTGVSKITITFTGAPDNGDKIVLQVGNGWSSDTGIELVFNHGKNHDSAIQPLGSSGVVDLEIDMLDVSVTNAAALTTHLDTKLSVLESTAVNGVDLKYYSVTKNGDQLIITALQPGIGWDILVTSLTNVGGEISYEIVNGIDSLWARENSIMFMDYFDQLPMESHDYSETERYTRIDADMLEVLTFHENRNTHIDRREWQESDYLYTSTGFINSQVTPQDGIIYREMKR